MDEDPNLNSIIKDRDHLSLQLQEAQAQLSEINARDAALQEKDDDDTYQLQLMQTQLRQMEQERDEARQQKDREANQLQQIEERLRQVEQERDAAREQNIALSNATHAAGQDSDVHTLNSLRRELEDAQQSISSLQESDIKNRKELSNAYAARDALRRELEDAEKSMAALRAAKPDQSTQPPTSAPSDSSPEIAAQIASLVKAKEEAQTYIRNLLAKDQVRQRDLERISEAYEHFEDEIERHVVDKAVCSSPPLI